MPTYLKLLKNNQLELRYTLLYKILSSCELCPRRCRVNRLKGEKGFCLAGKDLMVSSYFAHFGEESVLVGQNGSGTIFLSRCNLKCLYCQNYEISHFGQGRVVSEEECAQMMLELQKQGCHNINFVTPTPWTPYIVKAIKIAAEGGLYLPIVWNCSGYENVEVIKLLAGIVDIYMPDFKYGGKIAAQKYSQAPDYFMRAKEAIWEMYRQVGDLIINNEGVAVYGLLIRHLVLPNNLAESEKIFKFIAKKISTNTFINLMDQYCPYYQAYQYPELARRITPKEYQRALWLAQKAGLKRIFPFVST